MGRSVRSGGQSGRMDPEKPRTAAGGSEHSVEVKINSEKLQVHWASPPKKKLWKVRVRKPASAREAVQAERARSDVERHQQAVLRCLVHENGLTPEDAIKLFKASYLPKIYRRYPEEALHEEPWYVARKLVKDYPEFTNPH